MVPGIRPRQPRQRERARHRPEAQAGKQDAVPVCADVQNLVGWLTTVVGRVCLDMLRSRASRREEPLDVRVPDPIVSREEAPGSLRGRIPGAIGDGRLERAAGLPLSPANSQVLLCGNPDMLKDTTAVLMERGLRKHRRRAPGHITVESFW